jgi:hypothetical protein
VSSSACATATANAPVQRQPLDTPPAPPRVITPLPVPELPVVEPPAEDPSTAKPSAPPKPRPQASNANKPEPKPVEPPPAEPPATPPPAPTPPTPTLTTPPAQGDANAVTRQIRDSIERTRRTLEKIDYRPLSTDRKKAYDDSRLFATQAEDAIKVNNLVFARELADKAERLAKELQGR